MYENELDLCLTSFDLIYLIGFMRFGTYFISKLFILWVFWIFLMLEYYRHIRFHKIHQIPLLCYHQELACTPKDPPRRVDMKETGLISFYNKIEWTIDKTVWKPTLVATCENRTCALIYVNKKGSWGWGNHWGATGGPRPDRG